MTVTPSIAAPENLQTIPWQNLQVGKLLGQGGYSEVYQGNWNGKEVAIKQLLLKKLPEHLLKDFENETKIMAQCSKCAQIIRLLGVCMEEGHYSMLMEYMDKGSLYQVLQDEKADLPWEPLRYKIAIDIGKGLSYLHDREILHRDLKSLNILLDSNFNAKITDFGLSKIKFETKSTSTLHKQSAGTVRWKAPELFKRNAQHNKASDVYSYGMILWEIASRKAPFNDADDDITVMGWIKDGEQETIPTNTPPEYGKLVTRAWSKEPENRPTSHYLVLELEKLLPKPEAKSWHIDPETKSEGETSGKKYALVPASAKDVEKVIKFYSHHPFPGYEVGSVKVIYNPQFNRGFELHMSKLQERHQNPGFVPKWSLDENPKWREKVDEMARNLSKPYADPEYPQVMLFPLWHGTDPEILDSICRTGYANLATTDAGFFGKGLYSAHEAEYAYRVYSKGALVLNWVAVFSPYPTIDGDKTKLEKMGNFQNYDAHFVPVSPKNPNNSKESVYLPCKPFTPHTYTEVVVFESAACLPRYLVELQPTLSKQLKEAPIISATPALSSASKPFPPPPKSPALAAPPKPTVTASVKTETEVPAMAFGKAAWEQYIGDVGAEPPLPPDIDKILQSPCPFWPGKKVSETHLLTLIPKTVNGRALTLISLEDLVKAPKQGNATQYRIFNNLVKNEYGNTPVLTSYWVLVTRDVIEGSRWKTYEDQSKLVKDKAKSTGMPYTLPKAIEATVSILMHYFQMKEPLYVALGGSIFYSSKPQWTYTLCLEKVNNKQWPVSIGCFDSTGLSVDACGSARDGNFGVGASLKFVVEKPSINSEPKNTEELFKQGAPQVSAKPKEPLPKSPTVVAEKPSVNSESKDPEELCNLGKRYYQGDVVKQDYNLAVKYFTLAANQGYAMAQYNLGVCYEKGQGVKQDYSMAINYYKLAVDQGFAHAQYNLGVCYEKGQGVKQDYSMAIKYYKLAVDQGHADAQCNLGFCYEKGLGYIQEYSMAIKYYKLAAAQGHAGAQCNLGFLYSEGQGVKQDRAKSVKYYKLAAEQGNAEAQYYVGFCYEKGQGVKQDKAKAIKYYKLANAQHNQKASASLIRLNAL